MSPGSEWDSEISRRRFLALMAASAAVASAGCDRLSGRGEIVPYADQPEGTPPGTLRLYSSALPGTPGAPPVLVTAREGRPVKLDGNPEHPASGGALGGYAQAAILSLYDPDRIRGPHSGDKEAVWDGVDGTIRDGLAQAGRGGKGIALITSALVSPTARALVSEFLAAYPTARHLQLETFHAGEIVAAQEQVFGSGLVFDVDWAQADVVLSIESDFLGPTGCVGDQRRFAARRRPEGGPTGMNRLWCVESGLSVTGAMADHRLAFRPILAGRFLLGLMQAIVVGRGIGPLAKHGELAQRLAPYRFQAIAEEAGLVGETAEALVQDLVDHPGRGAVLVGAHMPAPVHVLAAALNEALGNLGPVLTPATGTPSAGTPLTDFARLADDMRAGSVSTVIALGANPAFCLPGDLGFPEALAKVPLVVSSSLIADETAEKAQFVLPAAHDLESWGDADCHPGVLTLQQPAIRPMFGARQHEESLLCWLPGSETRPATYYEYLRDRWQRTVYVDQGASSGFEGFWNAALHDGFVPQSNGAPDVPTVKVDGVLGAIGDLDGLEATGMDLVLSPSCQVYDGRYANNGWLQEMPHPLTSHVWGNGVFVGPDLASRLECTDGDALEVSVGGRSMTAPAIVVPGMAANTLQVDLGYGRSRGGSVGSGIGVDGNGLRSVDGGLSPWVYSGASVTRAEGRMPVVRTQEHVDLQGRNIVVEGTADQYLKRPDFAQQVAALDTSASPGDWAYATGQKWGMAVDLSLCTGCGACVVACTAENNVPVVGPDQVGRGREMQWIRIDRYHTAVGTKPGDLRLVHQPMLCQHCDNAPCENVCPVAATSHSSDGLNEMTYNRCVGTRYCANNCPYKVRRFNYYKPFEDLESPRELVFNPEVTVRSRGVMEKCTFCVQRIRRAQQSSRRDGRAMQDGEAVTACQQACPTGAIVFGDLNDPNSRVARLAHNPRGYHVLAELGVRPAITYLAMIRNPHPDAKA